MKCEVMYTPNRWIKSEGLMDYLWKQVTELQLKVAGKINVTPQCLLIITKSHTCTNTKI